METTEEIDYTIYSIYSPHSLGKLIEWKHLCRSLDRTARIESPLAGETN